MTKAVKVTLVVAGISLVLAGFFVVDQFFFPFTAKPPYFSDVEAVFNKIQIPPDWQQIESSENRGIRGKRCPIESDGCFSLVAIYKVPKLIERGIIERVMKTSGCPVVSYNRSEPLGGEPYSTFICIADTGINVESELHEKSDIWEIAFVVSS